MKKEIRERERYKIWEGLLNIPPLDTVVDIVEVLEMTEDHPPAARICSMKIVGINTTQTKIVCEEESGKKHHVLTDLVRASWVVQKKKSSVLDIDLLVCDRCGNAMVDMDIEEHCSDCGDQMVSVTFYRKVR